MPAPLTVRYLPDFLNGKSNPAEVENKDSTKAQFVDHPFLEQEEKDLLDAWIHCISSQNPDGHKGNNKNSWTVNSPDGSYESSNAESYKRFRMYHYHAVDPSINFPPTGNKTAWFLPENHSALETASLIHYSLKSSGEVIIMAFARFHSPFPKLSDHGNVLRNRTHK